VTRPVIARWALAAALALAAAGCASGPPAPVRLGHVPPRLEGLSDHAGLPGVAWAETATDALAGLDGALADPGDEDLRVRDHEGPVPPILAQTGTIAFDVPVVADERVDRWIQIMRGPGRGWYAKWLSRSTRYVPVFWPILEAHGLPKDLVFLSMIESGFSPRAYSWAHAAGPWQFIPGTGRLYGLRIDFWRDERRDFVKATDAAARHLRDLHAAFRDWHLAWAAYNAGAGKVQRAIKRTGSLDFWRLSRTRHLREETRQYVPKLLAAATIAKQPERHGFAEVEYLPPLRWEVVTVTVATDLATLARACGEPDVEHLELLNPELLLGISPPGEVYDFRVRAGRKEACADGLGELSPLERFTFRYHPLREGETVELLAARYSTRVEAILATNRLEPGQLASRGELVIPVPLAVADRHPLVEPAPGDGRPGLGPPGQSVTHRVRKGETLARIARRYGVSLSDLRRWNRLHGRSKLRIGQRLEVRAPPRASRSVVAAERPGARAARQPAVGGKPRGAGRTHRVTAGESLWSIAQKHGLTLQRLLELNGLRRRARLRIGQVIRLE
jgi:membrane-bound lytic murein transglycosylase D